MSLIKYFVFMVLALISAAIVLLVYSFEKDLYVLTGLALLCFAYTGYLGYNWYLVTQGEV